MPAKLEEIESVEKIKSENDYVYDLEIEDCHTFLANDIFVHNTDSIFLSMENHSIEDIQELADIISKEIAEHLKSEFNAKSTLEMEFEKIFKTVFFSKMKGTDKAAKKRYAARMIYKDGKECDKITITGFESKRSDCPQVIRDFQKDLFRLILNEKSQKEVDDFVDDFVKRFKSMPAEDIAFIKGISKDFKDYSNMPIHIRAALLANQRHGAEFKRGDKVKFIYVTSVPIGMTFENVIGIENKLPDGYKIDYKKMLDSLIWSKNQMIYESLGWARSTDGTKNLFEF